MLKVESLLDYTKMRKLYLLFVVSIEYFRKTLALSIFCSNCKNKDELIEILTINWDIKNYWFHWKYIITSKIWVKNIDWKI